MSKKGFSKQDFDSRNLARHFIFLLIQIYPSADLTLRISMSTLQLVDRAFLCRPDTDRQCFQQEGYLQMQFPNYFSGIGTDPIDQGTKTTETHDEVIQDIQGSGFVKIDLMAWRILVIVRAGLHPSFKMSKLRFPAESTLQ